jgi:hypothetical protein
VKQFFGPALLMAMVAIPGYVIWRVTTNVEDWFAYSGAGAYIGWAFVVAMCLACAAIPVGAWGLAARAWVVRIDEGQRLESTAHALAPARQRGQLATVEAAHALPHDSAAPSGYNRA